MADTKEGTTTVEPNAPKNEQSNQVDRLEQLKKRGQALVAKTKLTARMVSGCFVQEVGDVQTAKDGRPYFGLRLRGFALKAAYRNVWGERDKDGNIRWVNNLSPEQFAEYAELFEIAQEVPGMIDSADIALQGVAEVRLLNIKPEPVIIDGVHRTTQDGQLVYVTEPRVIAFSGESDSKVAEAYRYTLAAKSQQQNGDAEVEEDSDAIAQMNLN